MSVIRINYENQLNELTDRLVHLGSLTDHALANAVQSLVDQDERLATQVIEQDSEINELRYRIEEKCYHLLATQQPMAGDLRTIAAAISIATNMERMGDHASGIAVLSRRISNERLLKPLVDIPRMAQIGRDMLRDSIQAYLSRDEALAREIASRDPELNRLNEQILRELLTYMVDGPASIRQGTYLIWVAHNLERWGDRVKNICERVVYVVTGTLTDFDLHDTDELDAPSI
ncbi:MAG: phosphate signaling complex protein PhoU [Anaerolineales bacterium]|nr:phosphate signaling complex protein PhoU [Anaerolineales bacterium]MCB9128031.1 phosphate signaling complex protein PhoU [Ardenticatenales bacterium]MCB9172047.1 phosphate signaling complex protein PhoU [Ardenticatenales bacterium]